MVLSAAVLTLGDARAGGLSKDQVYRMIETGELERVGRGVYVRPDRIDPAMVSLAAATALQVRATMCLTSALVHHDLSDAIPYGTDIALPRGVRRPAGFDHVTWHSFDLATFDIGRTPLKAEGALQMWVYSAERTIVDCFRLAHLEGSDLGHTALRRWVQRRGSTPADLLRVAAAFPHSAPRIRQALEVLL
jgi:predicted transcriptional regulator of viral defense system